MAFTATPWGYDVDGTLPPLITDSEFDSMTGGKWAEDSRIVPTIEAASAAIRARCGWHVYPSMSCRATLDADGSRSLWLPTSHLTGVTSIEVDGDEMSGYQWSKLGQVLPADRVAPGLQAVTATYTAGFDELPADIAATVAGAVVRAVAMSYGVTAESAGGVSVSYANGAAYGGAGVSLTDADLAAIGQYRAVRAHAV